MDQLILREELHSHMHSLGLFCNALGMPMYQAECVEFLSELIHTCDSMIDDLASFSEPCEEAAASNPAFVERSAPFQWRMDDRPFNAG